MTTAQGDSRRIPGRLRHPLVLLAVLVLLALGGAVLALGLDSSGSTSKLVDGGSSSARATAELHRDFGEEPITIHVRGELTGLLVTRDIATLLGLEGCLSGNVPRRGQPLAPVCAEFAREKPVQTVYGPGTFVNEAAGRFIDQIGLQRSGQDAEARRAAGAARAVARAQGLSRQEQQRAAQSAGQVVYEKYVRDAYRLALRYGLTSVPALNNPDFVLQLVFEPRLGGDVPKPRFAYVFPDRNSALIQVRLRSGLSGSERRRAIGMVRRAVGSDVFRLKFGQYTVSGTPVIEATASQHVDGAVVIPTLAALAGLALLLALAFAVRRRFTALLCAGAAVAMTLGVAALLGLQISAAPAAAGPLIAGLGAGLAIRLQGRLADRVPEKRPAGLGTFARAAWPGVAMAAVAVAVGVAAMLLSPAPMARELSALVVLGLGLALAVAIVTGSALASIGAVRWDRVVVFARTRFGPRASHLVRIPAVGNARALAKSAGRRLADGWQGLLRTSVRHSRIALGAGLLVAAVGWIAAAQMTPARGTERLLPSGAAESADSQALRRGTRAAGEVSVLVRAADVAKPRVLNWMAAYQARISKRHGYRPGRQCARSVLCPALSLTSLFGNSRPRTEKQARALVRALPTGFANNVISRDRTAANMAFIVRTASLDDQQSLFSDMRAQLDPPAGVEAELAGQPVLEAAAATNLGSSRWILTLVAALAMSGTVLAVGGGRAGALWIAMPLLMATGWAWLGVLVTGAPLDPLSAALGAVVVGVSGQRAVAFARLHRERSAAAGSAKSPREWLDVGRAERLAGAAALIGLGAPALSGVQMLRDFGLAAAIGGAVALTGMALLMPAAIALGEQLGPLRVPRSNREATVFARRGRDA